jgi:hypothetical protein
MIEIQTQQDLGRAKNALQNYLIRKLLIPKVYLDAEWDGEHVDVLAIDRAGVGDVHAVRIVFGALESAAGDILMTVKELRKIPGHYRYVAAVLSELFSYGYESIIPDIQQDKRKDEQSALRFLREMAARFPKSMRETTFDNLPLEIQDWSRRCSEEATRNRSILRETLAEDGVGRVGILFIDLDLTADEPEVQSVLKPERFRSSKEIVELADRYVAEHAANWEFRE